MSVFININPDGENREMPPKIENLRKIGTRFFVPKSIFFSKSLISETDYILEKYEEYIGATSYIVRSAQSSEDGHKKSYAGVYMSKRGQSSQECLKNDIYEVAKNLNENDALIIQEYIKADYSGIYFSSVGKGRCYIEYIRGGNEGLTAGTLHASSILFDTDLHPLTSTLRLHSGNQNADGVESDFGYFFIPIDIQELLIRELSRLSQEFLYDTDVEWLIQGDTLYIAQVRPITTPFEIEYAPPKESITSKALSLILEKCRYFLEFFEHLGFERTDMVFDSGGGLLASGIRANTYEQEQLASILEEDKVYLLFTDKALNGQKLFKENERHELRLENEVLEKKFNRLKEKLSLSVFLARLPPSNNLSLFCDSGFGTMFFLQNTLPFHELLNSKNASEGISDIKFENEIPFSFESNMKGLQEEIFFVSKDTSQAFLVPTAFVGFDIENYTLHPSIKLLILERENHLSHGAILARELGIPCLYGVRGIVHRLQGGEKISIDRTNHLIKIID